MIKTITLDEGKEIRLSDSAAFLLVYKAQFGREPIQDLLKVQQAFTVKEGEELDTLDAMQRFDMEIIYNIAWALAKVGNTTTKDPIKFYSEFGDFKPIEHINDILDMALRSLSPSFSLEIEEEEEKN